MRVVVNHLTRMHDRRICVAGIDLESKRHIRPVLPQGNLTSDYLDRFGGPLAIGSVLDIGEVADVGRAPEWEDRQYDKNAMRKIGMMMPRRFWSLLQEVSRTSLYEIFGSDLKFHKQTYITNEGMGAASLGVFAPACQPLLGIYPFDERPRVRLRVHHGTEEAWLPVTDVRLFNDDMVSPNKYAIDIVKRKINSGVRVLLSVGLSRAWAPSGASDGRCHWLQVNNLHLEDDPIGMAVEGLALAGNEDTEGSQLPTPWALRGTSSVPTPSRGE